MKYSLSVLFVLSSLIVSGQVTLQADGAGNTYELINSVLAPSYNVIETPDCVHTDFGRHITEEWDSDLGTNVFVFHVHVDEDNDRCIKFDRQRTEIKTYNQSPDNLVGIEGETVLYKWKFKLDAAFQPSTYFTHIHQIKAVGGTEDAIPSITLVPRKSSTDKLQILHSSSATQTEVASADLSLFLGVWVQVTERITYGEVGTSNYEIKLSRVDNGTPLLVFNDDTLRMWKTNADIMRPKWGIYRSLNNTSDLRDEQVKFADFSIEEYQSATVGDVIITEIMIDPSGNEIEKEWFELHNTTASAVNLKGYTIGDISNSSLNHFIDVDLIIQPNGYAVLTLNNDINLNGGITSDYVYGSISSKPGSTSTNFPRWNNEGSFNDANPNDGETDGIILSAPNGVEIDRVAYDFDYSGIGLPNQGHPQGYSIELNVDSFSSDDNDIASNWSVATEAYGDSGMFGTPGIQNTLSVNNLDFINALTVYPNPASENIFIKGVDTINTIKVYSLLRTLVKSVEKANNFNVSELPSGIYIIKVNNNKGEFCAKMVVR